MLQIPVLSAHGSSCPPQTYDNSKRYEPLRGHVAYGYPSSGGILIKAFNAVELLHLNLDRFKEAKRSSDPANEDEFCKRFRNIGTVWWPSEGDCVNAELGEGDSGKTTKVGETGWPSSENGVWVLKYDVKKLEYDSWGCVARS
jgi:hypothetical protein